jgi:hypothetical protein
MSRIPKLRSNAISVAGTVTMGTIPISRMGDVYEYVGAVASLVDPDDITHVAGALTFDVAGGGSDEVYDFVAYYDTSYSTYPVQQAQYSTSNLASITEALISMVSGDMIITPSPATLGSSAAAVNAAIAGAGFTRTVAVTLQNTAGKTLYPYNGTLPVSVAEVTAGDGTSNLAGVTEITFVSGVASVEITYIGTWANTDIQTLTIGSTSTVLGYSVADATSVDTLIA